MINIPQTTAVTTSAQLAVTVPPGVCSVVLSCTGTQTVYVGTSSNVTTTSGGQGFPLPAGATVTLPGFPGSKGSTLYVIAGATGSTLGVILSTAG